MLTIKQPKCTSPCFIVNKISTALSFFQVGLLTGGQLGHFPWAPLC